MIPTKTQDSIRRVVVDAIAATMPREHIGPVCRALLDDDDLPCALTFVYYGLTPELRTEDAVLGGLADWIDAKLGAKAQVARTLRLRAHDLRITGLEKQLRVAEAALWRAERA